jgi:uncharacterized protein involved in exopolysaccharide biosynthesis
MAQVKNTSQEGVEKKFKDVFERSPGAQGNSMEEKIHDVAKRSEELENKMKNFAELNQKFKSQKGHVAEEVRRNLETLILD